MSVKLQVIHLGDIVRTKTEGSTNFKIIKRNIARIAALDKPSDFEILIDARKTLPKVTPFEIWRIAAELDKYRSTFRKKTALLVPEVFFQEAKFLEICAKNRSLHLRAFKDFEEAIDWLGFPEQAKGE